MSESFHGSREAIDWYGRRTLEANVAPVLDYISKGQAVLDVGCGPGVLTIQIAQNVHPGSVIGVDREEKSVSEGRQLAEKLKVGFWRDVFKIFLVE